MSVLQRYRFFRFDLLPEIPLEQTRERLPVPGFISRHLMHGVVDDLLPKQI